MGVAHATPNAEESKMTYSVNKDAIIFLDIDKENNYHTIAYDYKSDDVVAIRPPEYRLLKYILENQPVSEGQLLEFSINNPDIDRFRELVAEFVNKNVLLANE